MTSSARTGARNLATIFGLEDAGCSVSSSDDQHTTSTQSGYSTAAAEWCTQMYIPESFWGNLTNVSTHSNFCMGNLTNVSTHSNFRMGNLTNISTCSNFRIGNLTNMSTHSNFRMDNLTNVSTRSNFHMSNLTNVSTCSNFHMANLNNVSTCSNFCMVNLTKVSTHLNLHIGNLTKISTCLNFCMGNLTTVSTCSNFCMCNLSKVSFHLNFPMSNLTKVSVHSNFHMSNLAIWSQPAGYNKPDLLADYVPLSRGCYNPHLTFLMLPFCTEKADFVQFIYWIHGFVTEHVSKLFWWIYQSIPCTITNFADRYSEILNWISCFKIIAELPCWSISELILSTHQNIMRQQDFTALKIKIYHYTLKKQYKCKTYA